MKSIKRTSSARAKIHAGASLLEVLISLFVLGVGILGVLAMQAQAIKLNSQAYNYTKAVFLANDYIERMRANVLQVAAGDYLLADLPMGSAGAICSLDCSPAQLAAADVTQWANHVREALPNPEVTVTLVPNPTPVPTVDDRFGIRIIGHYYRVEITFSSVDLEGVNVGDETARERFVLVSGV